MSWKFWAHRIGAIAILWLILAGMLGCGTGEGVGEITSDRLFVPGCWDGPFDLQPDFFGGVAHNGAFQIRIQRGSDLEDVSDGVSILVDDVHDIRGDGKASSKLGLPLRVGLPPDVTPPGSPPHVDPSPPGVHLTLYLHRTCHTQISALYAVDGFIVFQHLFNGNSNETSADERLTEARFEVVVADPRRHRPGSGEIPAEELSRVKGWFRFYFERGQPAQPFP